MHHFTIPFPGNSRRWPWWTLGCRTWMTCSVEWCPAAWPQPRSTAASGATPCQWTSELSLRDLLSKCFFHFRFVFLFKNVVLFSRNVLSCLSFSSFIHLRCHWGRGLGWCSRTGFCPWRPARSLRRWRTSDGSGFLPSRTRDAACWRRCCDSRALACRTASRTPAACPPTSTETNHFASLLLL